MKTRNQSLKNTFTPIIKATTNINPKNTNHPNLIAHSILNSITHPYASAKHNILHRANPKVVIPIITFSIISIFSFSEDFFKLFSIFFLIKKLIIYFIAMFFFLFQSHKSHNHQSSISSTTYLYNHNRHFVSHKCHKNFLMYSANL